MVYYGFPSWVRSQRVTAARHFVFFFLVLHIKKSALACTSVSAESEGRQFHDRLIVQLNTIRVVAFRSLDDVFFLTRSKSGIFGGGKAVPTSL